MLIFIIRLIHFILLLVLLGAPFYKKDYIKYSIIILILILYKWNIDGSCGLTKLEYILLGHTDESEGFIYRLINPFLSIPENKFDKYLNIITIIYIILLIIIYNYK